MCALVGQIKDNTFNMQGATTKIIEAQQTKVCNVYKNTKLKLLKTNAAIWFNKLCRMK